MRRTRGDIGRRRLLAAATLEAADADFFLEAWPLAVLLFFDGMDVAGADFLLAVSDAAGGAAWEKTTAGIMHRSPSPSTDHNLRPNRATLIFRAEARSSEREMRELP